MRTQILKYVLVAILTLTNLQAVEVSLEDKIASLYVSFFNRAPDAQGLDAWRGAGEAAQARGENVSDVLKQLSRGFATHPTFVSTYGNLNNLAFVEEIYRNALGRAGDTAGVAAWTGALDGGKTRSDMVAEFMETSLTVDLIPSNFPTLSQAELDAAIERQRLITNKVEVAVYFAKNLGALTNVVDIVHPENEPAYLASIAVLRDVGVDAASVSSATGRLRGLLSNPDAINAINASWDDLIAEILEISNEVPVNSPINDYFGDSVAFSDIGNHDGLMIDCVAVDTNQILRLTFNLDVDGENILFFNAGMFSPDSLLYDPANLADDEIAKYTYAVPGSGTSIPLTAEIIKMGADTTRYETTEIASTNNTFETATNIMIGRNSCHVYHILSSRQLADAFNELEDLLGQL